VLGKCSGPDGLVCNTVVEHSHTMPPRLWRKREEQTPDSALLVSPRSLPQCLTPNNAHRRRAKQTCRELEKKARHAGTVEQCSRIHAREDHLLHTAREAEQVKRFAIAII
jgi:hypothetical protein